MTPTTPPSPPEWLTEPGIPVSVLARQLGLSKQALDRWLTHFSELTGWAVPTDPAPPFARSLSPKLVEVLVAAHGRCARGGSAREALLRTLQADGALGWGAPGPGGEAPDGVPLAPEVLDRRSVDALVSRLLNTEARLGALVAEVGAQQVAFTAALQGQREWDDELHIEVAQLSGNVGVVARVAAVMQEAQEEVLEVMETSRAEVREVRSTLAAAEALRGDVGQVGAALMDVSRQQVGLDVSMRVLGAQVQGVREALGPPRWGPGTPWWQILWGHLRHFMRRHGAVTLTLGALFVGGNLAVTAPTRALAAQQQALLAAQMRVIGRQQLEIERLSGARDGAAGRVATVTPGKTQVGAEAARVTAGRPWYCRMSGRWPFSLGWSACRR